MVARTNLTHGESGNPLNIGRLLHYFDVLTIKVLLLGPLKAQIKLETVEVGGWIAGTRRKHARAWVEKHRFFRRLRKYR